MKVEFNYCGIDCKFELEEADDIEVNPVPILEALVKVYNSISYYKSVKLVMTSDGV